MSFYLFSLAEVYSTQLTASNPEKLNRGQGFGRGTGTSQCTGVSAKAQGQNEDSVMGQGTQAKHGQRAER